jgi:tRNA threonylcarbamoyladenosine biosynthesis protein TsaE
MQNKQKKIVYLYDQLAKVVKAEFPHCQTKKIITFTGGLGAGKTTFIRHLLALWGVDEHEITSPTFAYVNRHKNGEGIVFYHFDLYRIQTVESFIEAGFAEYLYQPSSVVLIEWPHPILSLLKVDVLHYTFEYGEQEDQRIISKNE